MASALRSIGKRPLKSVSAAFFERKKLLAWRERMARLNAEQAARLALREANRTATDVA